MINSSAQVVRQDAVTEAISTASSAAISNISQSTSAEATPQTSDPKGLELIKYLANKSRLNQRPTDNEIKILTAATNAMERTRANFGNVRVNVHASQDPSQLQYNARKLEIARGTYASSLGLNQNIVFDAAISDSFRIGNCGEYAALDHIYFIESVANNVDVGNADMLNTIASTYFFESADHICNVINYKQTVFEKDVEPKPRLHWVTVQKTLDKSLIMDSWAYGPAVLEEDYQFASSMLNVRKGNFFPLNNEHYDEGSYYSNFAENVQDAADKKLVEYKANKVAIAKAIPDVTEYYKQDHSDKIIREEYDDFGQRFMCDESLLKAPANSLQSEINFVVAAKEVTGCGTKEAVKLFKKVKF